MIDYFFCGAERVNRAGGQGRDPAGEDCAHGLLAGATRQPARQQDGTTLHFESDAVHSPSVGVGQGAGLALAAALDQDRPLGGVVALSPLLPPSLARLCSLRDAIDADARALAQIQVAAAGLRVLVCEGGQDRVAPGAFSRPLYAWMTGQGARVQVEGWAEMGHRVALDELCRVREFLCEALPAQAAASDAAARMEQGPGAGADGAGKAARYDARTERESAAAGGARQALGLFVDGWSDPAAAVWAAVVQPR